MWIVSIFEVSGCDRGIGDDGEYHPKKILLYKNTIPKYKTFSFPVFGLPTR
jgi:hypothetical protein